MRAHLTVIVVVVFAVFVAIGAFIGQQALHTAQREARLNATYLAGVAADTVGENVALGESQVLGVAASPGLAQVLADPSVCQLTFDLELFPGSRLDVLDAEGRVVCSSLPGVVGDAKGVEAGWQVGLASAQGLFHSASFVDEPTGQTSVVIATHVVDPAERRIGAVALVLPTTGVADQLAVKYGGRRGYEFGLADESTGSVLSLSLASPDRGLGAHEQGRQNPLRDDAFMSGVEPIPGTTWQAYAGMSEAGALGPTRSVLWRGAWLGVAVLLVLLASLSVMNWRIARPLRRLTDALGHTGARADQALRSVSGPAEVVRLADGLRASIAAYESAQEQLSHQALHDPLTGLPNRALLAERLAFSLEWAASSERTVAVLFLDLDRFKLVNDGLGHSVGDQLLVTLAARLSEVLRPGDTLARFGGDEFVIVAGGLEDGQEVEELAGRLLAAAAEPVEAGDTIVRMTASIGVALSGVVSRGGDLLRDADTAMYHAKQRGGARHERFNGDLGKRVTTRLALENEFRVALERQELRVVYQPQVDLETGDTVGVEALLRWDHPALGPVPPTTFIPIAEETGLIVPVGRFVLEQACKQVVTWQREGIDVTVAVNISARQLADDALVEDVARTLAETGVDPTWLCLELTESVLMHDSVRASRTLQDLHDLGCQLSIDDFGTGFSSLAYLHRFSVDELKIDRLFVQGLCDQPDQRSLVAAMVAMGKALGLRIVAEGVETPEQAAGLRSLGCPTGQGYLFARPGRPEQISGMLRRSRQVMFVR